ncbi:hypothetical protein BKG82_10560 [Mycobacteroides chelonae]|uniref:Membrane protein (DUF2339) n=2 Tax=Mycobacteriaceae TaxID=1762 RepID=A0A1S1LQ60_MYCCH|nr:MULTISPECIES: DUF2339 domain-containing protein [Mycobacteroides]KRQ19017.1 hypothetical protein AOT87_25170 [Mycobacteroides sp. H003]KRQ21447.1 hypothetical protein AOT91_25960 [Mycobacteroides sp. H092]KRQ44498.1 hypothetical protein AOT92_05985 [Mycobacteroides sp. H101]KRQ52529.1 hypothetical protein AOT88_04335 [Mycobacteroides sp. H063]KRQ57033.1 hypothetical protein AOT94_16980 [Mycobacteroides sp. HXVII]
MFTTGPVAATLRGMTDPQLQQMTAALDELDGRERALRAELDALRGRMVEWTQAEYLKAQRYWDDYRRAQGAPPLAAPVPATHTPAAAPVPPVQAPLPTTPPPREPFWAREGFASKAMALAGAVVTLAGVVMLLVLAAKSGYFGPVPRMASGAVLAAGLVGLGVRVQSRPGGRIGGIATAATGFAAGYFDVLALTVIYQRIPVMAGLALGLTIAGAGLVLARQWNSQPFAAGMVAAITVLAPFLTDGFTVELAAFALVLLIASLPAQIGRNWPVLHAFRTVGVALTLLAAIGHDAADRHPHALLAMAVLALGVTLVGSLWLLTGEDNDPTSSIMIAVACVPVLYNALLLPVWPLGVLVPVGVAAVMGAVLLLVGGLPMHARITMAAVAGLALLQAAVDGTREGLLVVVLLAIALSFCTMGYQIRDRISLVLGQVFGGLGGMAYIACVPPEMLANSNYAVHAAGPLLIVASVLAAATTGMMMAAMHRVGWASAQSAPVRGVLAAVSMLYSGTAAIVLSGTALLGNNDGFLLGHGVATVSWMALSVALLLAGLRRYRDQSWFTRTGFVLAAMAVAKLFLFDLATLDGIARIGAFIVTGLLLLGGGTLYAREYATSGEQSVTEVPTK